MAVTICTTLYAESLAEPCPAFGASDGSPLCDGCGWLDTEHAAVELPAYPTPPKPVVRHPARRRGAPRLAAVS